MLQVHPRHRHLDRQLVFTLGSCPVDHVPGKFSALVLEQDNPAITFALYRQSSFRQVPNNRQVIMGVPDNKRDPVERTGHRCSKHRIDVFRCPVFFRMWSPVYSTCKQYSLHCLFFASSVPSRFPASNKINGSIYISPDTPIS